MLEIDCVSSPIAVAPRGLTYAQGGAPFKDLNSFGPKTNQQAQTKNSDVGSKYHLSHFHLIQIRAIEGSLRKQEEDHHKNKS